MLLHEFLIENRAELLVRCASKSARRPSAMHIDADIAYGVPQFLEQLIKTLRAEHIGEPEGGIAVSGPAGGGNPVMSEIGETAARHGRELSRDGYTVDQVVHDYGDICQAITDLAFERKLPIEVHQFRTLNRCLDNGIADAVSEFSYQRNTAAANEGLERLGFLAHELRNQLLTATLALGAIKKGQVGVDGLTGMVLERSLVALRSLIDNSLAEVRMSSGMPANQERVSLAGFIAGVKAMASVSAAARECKLTVPDVDGTLGIDIDSGLLASGLGNLLQNAFKFTRPHTEVCVHAYAGRRSCPDRSKGPLRRPPGGAWRKPVSAVRAGRQQQIRPGPRAGDRQAQRSDEPRHPQREGSAWRGLRVHDRPTPKGVARAGCNRCLDRKVPAGIGIIPRVILAETLSLAPRRRMSVPWGTRCS
jgi:hypothetical protein